MCSLCYERAWYAKLGGCKAIKFMFDRMSLKWILDHQFLFLKALLFVMMDLTGEVGRSIYPQCMLNKDYGLTLNCFYGKLVFSASDWCITCTCTHSCIFGGRKACFSVRFALT